MRDSAENREDRERAGEPGVSASPRCVPRGPRVDGLRAFAL